jgi:hypothetical protein
MTKNELMEMARKAGFMFHDAGYAPTLHTLPREYSDKCFDRLFNAILERAAIQFKDDDDWSESRYTGRAVSEKILSLKIPTN